MFERFTQAARSVVIDAQAEARRLRHERIGTEHLLLALLRQGDGAATTLRDVGVTPESVEAAIDWHLRNAPGQLGEGDAAALRAFGIDLAEVRSRIAENFGPVPLPVPPKEPRRWFGLRRPSPADGERQRGHVPFSRRSKQVLKLSLQEAARLKHRHIAAEHILLGLLRENGGLAALILTEAGVDLADLRDRAHAALRAAA